jgi:hypothetical protein
VSAPISTPEPLACATFLLIAMAPAGLAHSLWLNMRCSRRFAIPIDAGKTMRGRRWLGDNKMWRGFMVLPPAAAVSFVAMAAMRGSLPEWLGQGMWLLPVWHFAFLGFIAGLAFMLAELPNSLLKRQLGVNPGLAPKQPLLAALCFVLDRSDSVLGMMLALSLLVPIAARTWLWALLIGGGAHALFSALLYRLRVKARPL